MHGVTMHVMMVVIVFWKMFLWHTGICVIILQMLMLLAIHFSAEVLNYCVQVYSQNVPSVPGSACRNRSRIHRPQWLTGIVFRCLFVVDL